MLYALGGKCQRWVKISVKGYKEGATLCVYVGREQNDNVMFQTVWILRRNRKSTELDRMDLFFFFFTKLYFLIFQFIYNFKFGSLLIIYHHTNKTLMTYVSSCSAMQFWPKNVKSCYNAFSVINI